jgi:glycine betaine transporter
MASAVTRTDARRTDPERRTDPHVTAISGGLLSVFVLVALVAPESTATWVGEGFDFATRWFGLYWQILLLVTFVVAVALAVSPWGRVRLGGGVQPEFGRFKWVAMVMCTLLAGGGVFWAAAEPMYHFTSPPPFFGAVEAGSDEAARNALAQSFLHWGFLVWAILGTLGAVVMMRGAQKGYPLRPRTLLYPVLGERIRTSVLGSVVDVACIIAVVAGTVGPIGFLGLQVSFGLSEQFGAPNNYATQLAVIVALTAVAVVSVATGLHRGIQVLSRLNIIGALVLMGAVLLLGSVVFVLTSFVGAFGVYVRDFVSLSLYQGDAAWAGGWTIFFFGWFLGYAPLMAIFIARISRGRTLRELVGYTAVLPPVTTAFWFTVLGGTGIWLEQRTPGEVSEPLAESGLPAAVISIANGLPLGAVLAVGFLVLSMTFVATTTDSMSYAIAAAGTTRGEPDRRVRAGWAVLLGVAAAALISVGDGGIGALQSFIVVTAVPVGFVMLPALWAAPLIARDMAQEQGICGYRSRHTQAPSSPRATASQPMELPCATEPGPSIRLREQH